MTMTKIRTYSEFSRLASFEERFRYLQLSGSVGKDTFGFERYLNQKFYRSPEWKRVRDFVIVRDNGCDLGVDGYVIPNRIVIHHMNPISAKDIESMSGYLLNPEFLVCTTHQTHNAIHYGDENLLPQKPAERYANDTCLWKH